MTLSAFFDDKINFGSSDRNSYKQLLLNKMKRRCKCSISPHCCIILLLSELITLFQ